MVDILYFTQQLSKYEKNTGKRENKYYSINQEIGYMMHVNL